MIARRRRPGFTLLEVLLASAIGVLLLGALYMAFNITLKQGDAGREAVEHGDLGRALVNRMSIDLSGCLGPLQPKSGGGLPQEATASSSSSTTAASGSTTGATTTGTTTTGTSGGTADLAAAAATATAAAETTEPVAADVPFQGGVFGSDKQLTLYVSRVPPALTGPDMMSDPRPDLRRITYYLGSNGGLCRQERSFVTADGVRNSADPDYSSEGLDRIAEEVTDVTFEYFDGGSWASQWTGSDPTTDGTTPIGPPRAVRVTLTVQLPGAATAKIVRHVFPLRAANGLAAPPAVTTAEDPAATTGTTGGM